MFSGTPMTSQRSSVLLGSLRDRLLRERPKRTISGAVQVTETEHAGFLVDFGIFVASDGFMVEFWWHFGGFMVDLWWIYSASMAFDPSNIGV